MFMTGICRLYGAYITLQVNQANAPDLRAPFGGYKQSGIGREFGKYALDTYLQYKGVLVNLEA
jgi:acyl-CoA reductase-like NAD-dependent aldehyde dehydrogenase